MKNYKCFLLRDINSFFLPFVTKFFDDLFFEKRINKNFVERDLNIMLNLGNVCNMIAELNSCLSIFFLFFFYSSMNCRLSFDVFRIYTIHMYNNVVCV